MADAVQNLLRSELKDPVPKRGLSREERKMKKLLESIRLMEERERRRNEMLKGATPNQSRKRQPNHRSQTSHSSSRLNPTTPKAGYSHRNSGTPAKSTNSSKSTNGSSRSHKKKAPKGLARQNSGEESVAKKSSRGSSLSRQSSGDDSVVKKHARTPALFGKPSREGSVVKKHSHTSASTKSVVPQGSVVKKLSASRPFSSTKERGQHSALPIGHHHKSGHREGSQSSKGTRLPGAPGIWKKKISSKANSVFRDQARAVEKQRQMNATGSKVASEESKSKRDAGTSPSGSPSKQKKLKRTSLSTGGSSKHHGSSKGSSSKHGGAAGVERSSSKHSSKQSSKEKHAHGSSKKLKKLKHGHHHKASDAHERSGGVGKLGVGGKHKKKMHLSGKQHGSKGLLNGSKHHGSSKGDKRKSGGVSPRQKSAWKHGKGTTKHGGKAFSNAAKGHGGKGTGESKHGKHGSKMGKPSKHGGKLTSKHKHGGKSTAGALRHGSKACGSKVGGKNSHTAADGSHGSSDAASGALGSQATYGRRASPRNSNRGLKSARGDVDQDSEADSPRSNSAHGRLGGSSSHSHNSIRGSGKPSASPGLDAAPSPCAAPSVIALDNNGIAASGATTVSYKSKRKKSRDRQPDSSTGAAAPAGTLPSSQLHTRKRARLKRPSEHLASASSKHAALKSKKGSTFDSRDTDMATVKGDSQISDNGVTRPSDVIEKSHTADGSALSKSNGRGGTSGAKCKSSTTKCKSGTTKRTNSSSSSGGSGNNGEGNSSSLTQASRGKRKRKQQHSHRTTTWSAATTESGARECDSDSDSSDNVAVTVAKKRARIGSCDSGSSPDNDLQVTALSEDAPLVPAISQDTHAASTDAADEGPASGLSPRTERKRSRHYWLMDSCWGMRHPSYPFKRRWKYEHSMQLRAQLSYILHIADCVLGVSDCVPTAHDNTLDRNLVGQLSNVPAARLAEDQKPEVANTSDS